MSVQKKVKRVTTHVLSEMKLKGEKISMLTAYDFSMAQIIDNAGIDVILVGDSASNVMAGKVLIAHWLSWTCLLVVIKEIVKKLFVQLSVS